MQVLICFFLLFLQDQWASGSNGTRRLHHLVVAAHIPFMYSKQLVWVSEYFWVVSPDQVPLGDDLTSFRPSSSFKVIWDKSTCILFCLRILWFFWCREVLLFFYYFPKLVTDGSVSFQRKEQNSINIVWLRHCFRHSTFIIPLYICNNTVS